MKVLKSNKLKEEGGKLSKGSPSFLAGLGSSAFFSTFYSFLGAAYFYSFFPPFSYLSAFTVNHSF